MKSGSLQVSGRLLEYDISGPAHDFGFVFVHGLGSDRRGDKARYFAEFFGQRGFGYAALDTTGHGGSEGEIRTLTLTRQIDDLAGFLGYIRRKEEWTGRVVLIGSSLGGLTSAWTSVEEPEGIAGLALIAPAFRFVDNIMAGVGERRVREWRDTNSLRIESPWLKLDFTWDLAADWQGYEHDSLASRLRVPALILHGTRDEQVPVDDSRRVAAASGGRVKLVEIPGGDHRLTDHKEKLAQEILAFVRRELGWPEPSRAG